MAVVENRRERCDGCGRTVSLEALTTVTMPDGERLACCERCEPHARQAADKLSSLEPTTERCDGCREEFTATRLDDLVLTDGTVVSCCPDCRASAPEFTDAPGDETEADDRARSSADEGDTASAETTELATRQNLCGQCHEWIDVEPFRVTTIDGRTEELCADCKELAEEKGIVTDVQMRRSEAREILGVEAGDDEQAIRQAFLQQIKHAHPDRKSGSRSAFKLVKEAYDTLG